LAQHPEKQHDYIYRRDNDFPDKKLTDALGILPLKPAA
jgi:hypothetical protein